ncbi:PIN domain-containing protein [Sulfolobus acidocaldarius]|uniref:Ribonuclease VapC n=4 Tax=Sulfolobus acidocaldarius TaxID=2285 RepID=Q4J7A5_SULAC|nr:PIN domain-containing protein [Sulfolobus acidocaldarius]AAY81326.1 conserved Archaeal PIN domain protein [Sulfolobus acidocaldarius DSM 639]AGE71968.1 PIN domain-containing protein [Sulfolobus acidocaldarius N8]AGE74240.1 PIN domain-containing protein [Sulfolobus acidocaldarius Ron12/I]ALU29872.1 twitching motility protein PilT [Sulfolobus acidocaldarius]ALU32612.1 twitching motility protein PilT [Sulfolobus acidocaldarius]
MLKRKLAIVDTNVLIFDFIEDSQYHDVSRKLLNSLDRMLILPNILVEFILVSRRLKIRDEDIRSKVDEILKNSILVGVKKEDIKEAISLSLKEINDAIIVSVAKRLNLPIISLDRDVKELGKIAGVIVVDRLD